MWNELALSHRFSLYCAYPEVSLTGVSDLAGIQQVCTHHSNVVVPRDYGRPYSAADYARGPGRNIERLVESSEVFIPAPIAVRAARHFATMLLRAWRLDSILDEASLVVSELAANAVEHANSAFRLSLMRGDKALTIKVEDLSPEQPRLRRSSAGPGGRGLLLIDALCSRWGVDVDLAGKCVWAEFMSGAT
jgi:anti-sigma regulatory factor (Ser/Thr protein kinase)